MAPTDLTARVTVLSEGTRGTLSQAWCQWQQVTSANPQIFALGVKEVWKVARPLDRVIHTMGWPLPSDAFGGSWCYPHGAGPGVASAWWSGSTTATPISTCTPCCSA